MIEKHALQQVVPKSQATHWYDCVHVFGKNKFLTSGTYKTGKRKKKNKVVFKTTELEVLT